MQAKNLLSIAIVLSTTACAPGEPDVLARLELRATEGAAAGYIEDRGCGICHRDKYASYQKVGMARSFRRRNTVERIEAFGREYYHAPSKAYFEIREQDRDLVFRRYQRDTQGKPINVFETKIDWVLGSGNRARSYLYQTEWGELYQLPLGWYSETKEWGMSPGFEGAGHFGVERRVNRDCMFCHNAYPEVAAGSDLRWQSDIFPKHLPEGTGCQRCHGPGADHVRAALSGTSVETIRSRIVNPRKLPPDRRDSVCFQCHMLPASAVIGTRRFSRSDYSFRPGELLSDYLVHVEVVDRGLAREDRFEINHHGYRFWQSRCYRESRGALACISCHDPHVKPSSSDFRAKVSKVCLDCHTNQRDQHKPTLAKAASDCAACHMPTRRTQDVVLTTMTDHRIARGPFDRKALTRPLKLRATAISGVELLPVGAPPKGDEGDIYRMTAILRALADASVARRLMTLLTRVNIDSPVPHLELLNAQTQLKDYAGAESTAKQLIAREPALALGHLLHGAALVGLGRYDEAAGALERSLSIDPTPEGYYNLALAASGRQDYVSALQYIDRAIALRPNRGLNWAYRGWINARLGRLEDARDALVRSLEIDPGRARTYSDLVEVLRRSGDERNAERYRLVSTRIASQLDKH